MLLPLLLIGPYFVFSPPTGPANGRKVVTGTLSALGPTNEIIRHQAAI